MVELFHEAHTNLKATDAMKDESLAHKRGTQEVEPNRTSARRSTISVPSGDEKFDLETAEYDGDRDLESLLPEPVEKQPLPAEYSVSLTRKLILLTLYFLLSLGLTLSNKAIMAKAKLPWLLTVLHTVSTSIGSTILLATGQFRLSRLGARENYALVAFSSLFTLNIAISNVSLALVSVPFHQVLRATCPVATMLIYLVGFKGSYSQSTYLSMLPLIFGVALATFGDYYFSILGFTLTLLGVFLAAIKTVATNRLLTGSLALSAMEILFRMSPLAAVQCLGYAAISGELSSFRNALVAGTFDRSFVLAIVCNGTTAFLLNVVSFQTNKAAGALTMAVCGNVKQCMTILLGISLFAVKVSPLNELGMAITMAGAAWYSKVELDRKKSVVSA